MLKKTKSLVSILPLVLFLSSPALHAGPYPTEKQDKPRISYNEDFLYDDYKIRNELLSDGDPQPAMKAPEIPSADVFTPRNAAYKPIHNLERFAISSEGYGAARWGMRKSVVYDLFPNIEAESGDFITLGESHFAGISSKTTLQFVQDGLFRVVVLFNRKLSAAQKDHLEDHLFERFGNGELLNDGRGTMEIQWERPDTLIHYSHYDQTEFTMITFKSKTMARALHVPGGTSPELLDGNRAVK